ncbi:MAG: heme-dependent oxidative N-demethylase subunit alpha family protein [Chloroflexota bacterium]
MNDDLPALPSPSPPFMVRDRFAISADLYPLGADYNGVAETAHFVADDRWAACIAGKLAVLEREAGRASLHLEDDPGGLAEALWRVAGLLAKDEPSLAEMLPDGLRLPRLGLRLGVDGPGGRIEPAIVRERPDPLGERAAAWLEQRRGVARLADAIALACQEEIVIMRAAPGCPDVAESLQVCFPSGWDPRDKIGTGFRAIHEPIADNARLLGASANVMKALLTKGPYIRFSWSVTLHGGLDAHPDLPRQGPGVGGLADPAGLAARTFIRMERQTTFPMPDLDRGLFTIRVYVDPLLERIGREPGLRQRLARLIASTAPEVRDYKGIGELGAALLPWLETGEAAGEAAGAAGPVGTRQ